MLERDHAKAAFAQQRTEWEDKHLGGYKRIYPTPDSGERYSHLFDAAREIWGTTTGVTRTRPLLESLQQARRSAAGRSSNEVAQGSSKIPSASRGSAKGSSLSTAGNTSDRTQKCPSKPVANGDLSTVRVASSRLSSELSTKSLLSKERTTAAPQPAQPSKVHQPTNSLPNDSNPETSAEQQLVPDPPEKGESSPTTQRPFVGRLISTSSCCLHSNVQATDVGGTSALRLFEKADVTSFQVSTEAPSESQDTASISFPESCSSLTGIRSGNFGSSSFLRSLSLESSSAILCPPNLQTPQRIPSKQARQTDCLNASGGHSVASWLQSKPGQQLHLPTADLSMSMQPVCRPLSVLKRPTQKQGLSSSNQTAKASPKRCHSVKGAVAAIVKASRSLETCGSMRLE